MKTAFLYLFIIISGSNTQKSNGKSPERRNHTFNHCEKLKHEGIKQQINMRIFLNAPAYLFRLVSRMARPEKTSSLIFISEGKGGLYSFFHKQIRKMLQVICTEFFRCFSQRSGCLFLLHKSFFPKTKHLLFSVYLRRLLSFSSSSAEKGRRREKGFKNEDMIFEKVFCSSFALC